MPTQNELRTQITNQIVDALTKGGLPPWRQPWMADKNCGTQMAGSHAGELALVNISDLSIRTRIDKAHSDAITGVGYSPYGFMVTASADRTVRFWTHSGKPIFMLRFPSSIQGLWLTNNGRDLYLHVSGDRAIRHWRLDELAKGLIANGIEPGIQFD